jgi:hypothetical protein
MERSKKSLFLGMAGGRSVSIVNYLISGQLEYFVGKWIRMNNVVRNQDISAVCAIVVRGVFSSLLIPAIHIVERCTEGTGLLFPCW